MVATMTRWMLEAYDTMIATLRQDHMETRLAKSRQEKRRKSAVITMLWALFVLLAILSWTTNIWMHHSLATNAQSSFTRALDIMTPYDTGIQFDSFAYVREMKPFGIAYYPRPWDELAQELEKKQGDENHNFLEKANFAAITRKSNEHTYNQDRAGMIRPYDTKQTINKSSFLVMLLDGHGQEGDLLADYVREMLPQRLAEKLNSQPCCQSDEWIQQQLNETFLEVNEEAPPMSALRGGCTASITLRIDSKLYFANAGDSRTILVNYQNPQNAPIIYMTRFDKAHLPDERARIESMGGSIHTPKDHPNGSRVIAFSVSNIPHEPIGLAMSRSIGDWEWKPGGVIAEPITKTVDVAFVEGVASDSKLLLLAASDGVWDYRQQPDFYAKRFGQVLFPQTKQTPHGLFSQMKNVFLEVTPTNEEWYRDDMTALVVHVDM